MPAVNMPISCKIKNRFMPGSNTGFQSLATLFRVRRHVAALNARIYPRIPNLVGAKT